MKKKPARYATKISPVMPWKAFVGFAVDFFLSFSIMMVCNMFLLNPLADAFGYSNVLEETKGFIHESHLFALDPGATTLEATSFLYGKDFDKALDNNGKIKEAYSDIDLPFEGHYPYEFYLSCLCHYYFDFSLDYPEAILIDLEGKTMDLASKDSLFVRKTIGETFFHTDDESSYFAFPKDEGGEFDYSAALILNEENEIVAGLNSEDEDSALKSANTIRNFFVDSSGNEGLYITSCTNFMKYQTKYVSLFNEGTRITFFATLPINLLPPFIFLFLIPLCVPDGKSIGRLLNRLAVIDVEGYAASKKQIVLHQFLLFLPWLLTLLPFGLMGIISMVAVYLLDFLVYNLTPSKRSVHELLAGTLTVNDDDSQYFASKEELEEYLAENPTAYEDLEEALKAEAMMEKERREAEKEARGEETKTEEPALSDKEEASEDSMEEDSIDEAAKEDASMESDEEEDEDDFLDKRKK